MSIFTDGIHIISDAGLPELHAFANKCGINKCWFHNTRGKNHPHYDIPKRMVTSHVIKTGATLVHSKQLVKIIKIIQDDLLRTNENTVHKSNINNNTVHAKHAAKIRQQATRVRIVR